MAVKKANGTSERVTVKVPISRFETDDKIVVVNGRVYQIQRGKDVNVSPEVAAALEMSAYNENYALEKEREMLNNSRFN